MERRAVRLVAVGHVTNDRLESGLAAGGSALYAALAAAYMGAEAQVVTSFGEDFVGGPVLAAAGVEVRRARAAQTTTFENVYEGAGRRQRVLAMAAPLVTAGAEGDVVLACPVVGEVPDEALVPPPGGMLAAGLQGWLRAVEPDGTVVHRAGPPPGRFGACRAVFVGADDLDDDRYLARLAGAVPIVVCTHGALGADVYVAGARTRVAAFPTTEVDPTGAGDVFAAAFLVALARGEAPLQAAVVGACAASIVVEGPGPTPLPRLAAELAGRLARYPGPGT